MQFTNQFRILCFSMFVFVLTMGPVKELDAWQDHVSAASGTDEANPLAWVRPLYETYDQHALSPVVKQQFLLEVATAFYEVAGNPVPNELRHEAARLTSDDEGNKWLQQHLQGSGLVSELRKPGNSLLLEVKNRVLSELVPSASFVSQAVNRIDQQLAENQYVGIGIRVRWEADKAMIDDPFPGGAAYKAGVKPGDFILEVDGKSMEGLDLGSIVEELRGLEGSSVSVVLQNKDGSDPRTLDMVRTVVPIPSVHGLRQKDDGSWRFVADKDPVVAYVKVAQVVGSTSAELKQAAQQILAAGVNRVVLDLQPVMDGELHHVHMMADILCSGNEFGRLVSGNGESSVLSLRDDADFEGLQIAVLSPTGNVSGPVLGLLAALKARPHTRLFGPVIESNAACFDTFELSDKSGAIKHLEYARLVPKVVDAQGQQWGDQQGHAGSGVRPRIYFAPTTEVAGKQALRFAKSWLTSKPLAETGSADTGS